MRILIVSFIGILSMFGWFKEEGEYLSKEDVIYTETEYTPPVLSVNALETGDCLDQLNYLPDPDYPNHMPTRQIKVNFHFMYDKNGKNNISRERAPSYIDELIWNINNKIKKNAKMHLPLNNENPALFPGYQYVLTPNPNKVNDTGIYYHNDDELYWFVNKGKTRNDYNQEVFKKYGLLKNEVLNVFIMPHHPDSLASKTYRNQLCGIAFPSQNWTKIAGSYAKLTDTLIRKGKPFVRSAWFCHGVYNHELGHVLGLRHTWGGNDGCDDTPNHNNCYSAGQGKGNCKDNWSNNVMDYNTHQNSWSPCQIGLVQRNFANKRSSQRKVLIKTWCKLDNENPVMIEKDIVWKGSRDLESHIVIESGSTLTIKCRVSLPRRAQIIVKSGATLVLDGATIENDCNSQWDGIKLWGRGKRKGKVVMLNDPKLENMRVPLE